jgi:hypothetical protein
MVGRAFSTLVVAIFLMSWSALAAAGQLAREGRDLGLQGGDPLVGRLGQGARRHARHQDGQQGRPHRRLHRITKPAKENVGGLGHSDERPVHDSCDNREYMLRERWESQVV